MRRLWLLGQGTEKGEFEIEMREDSDRMALELSRSDSINERGAREQGGHVEVSSVLVTLSVSVGSVRNGGVWVSR